MQRIPPVNRLPNEILVAIFVAGEPEDAKELGLFLSRVGGTCMLWRQIVLHMFHVCIHLHVNRSSL